MRDPVNPGWAPRMFMTPAAFVARAGGPRPLGLLLALVLALLLAGCTSLPGNVVRPASQALALAQAQDTPLAQQLAKKRPAGTPQGQSGFALLASPNDAFAARLALAQQARRTLDLQYYLIHADPSAARLLQAVRAAAARGVRVRILLDDLHATGTDALVMAMAQVPGVQLRMANPLPGSRKVGALRTLRALTDFDRIQRRMHNKLFIADNAWAITGGRNLGDAYFGAATGSDYIDLDVLAGGPVVRELSAGFDRYWNSAVAYPADALITPAELANLRETTQPHDDAAAATTARALPPALDLARLPLQWASVQALVDNPDKLVPGARAAAGCEPEDAVLQGVLDRLDAAREDVLIVTPYFVPGDRMMDVFAALRARGVPVRVLTNSLSSTTSLLAQVGYTRYRERLLQLGVDLREMHARERARLRRTLLGSDSHGVQASLHAKLLVIDGQTLVIGSMNMDLRSQLQNTEVALLIDSEPLSQQAAAQVQAVIDAASWKLELASDGSLHWRAPSGADYPDAIREPDTSFWLRLLATLLAPYVPEELL